MNFLNGFDPNDYARLAPGPAAAERSPSFESRLNDVQLTQPERMRLSKLQQARATVDQQVAEGMLKPNEGAQFYAQIDASLQPLQERSAQAIDLAKQTAKRDLEDQTKTAAIAQGTGDTYMAHNLPNRIVPLTDPNTGQLRHYFMPASGPPVEMFPQQEGQVSGPLAPLVQLGPAGLNAVRTLAQTLIPPPHANATPEQHAQYNQALLSTMVQMSGMLTPMHQPQQSGHGHMQVIVDTPQGPAILGPNGHWQPVNPVVPGSTGGQFSQPNQPTPLQVAGMLGQGPGLGGLGMAAATAPVQQPLAPPPGLPPALANVWSQLPRETQEGLVQQLQGQQPQATMQQVPAGGQGQGNPFPWATPQQHGPNIPAPTFTQLNQMARENLALSGNANPTPQQLQAEMQNILNLHQSLTQPGQGGQQGQGQVNTLSGSAPNFSGNSQANFNPTMAFTNSELPQLSGGGSLTVPSGNYRGEWTEQRQTTWNNLHQAAMQNGQWQMAALIGMAGQLLHHYGSLQNMPWPLRQQYLQALQNIQSMGQTGAGTHNPGTLGPTPPQQPQMNHPSLQLEERPPGTPPAMTLSQ